MQKEKNGEPTFEGLEPSTLFREFAAECMELARNAASPEKRTIYLKMTRLWHEGALRWKKIHGHEISPYPRGGSFCFHVYLVSVSANARSGVAHRRQCGEAARPAAQTSGLFKQIIALDSQVYSGR
jgi:hypothetical protein